MEKFEQWLHDQIRTVKREERAALKTSATKPSLWSAAASRLRTLLDVDLAYKKSKAGEL